MQALRSGISIVLALAPVIVSAAPVSYSCNYTTYSDSDGRHRVTEEFKLTFIVDTSARKAYMIGNNGTAELQIVRNTDGVTLIEVTASGNVMVTAIARNGSSVHSRSTMISEDIVPSQYYGKCVAK